MTKYIVVIGGVISGVGKGVASASLGKILQEYGQDVTAVKIDPYLNCDAGTLRPTEHGEVWVTHDGGETDQDLGNYERFLNISIPRAHNITTGQVYKTVIDKERQGLFLGKTVQLIPHITDEIKHRVRAAGKDHDVVLVEIGGTVGDYENIPFLFAMKSLEEEIGKDNILYVLVTYLPIPSHIEEMKTKPTQISVKLLRENNIEPDFILCRGKSPLDEIRKKKIEVYAHVKADHIISMPNVIGEKTKNTLYTIPLDLEQQFVGEKMLTALGLSKKKEPEWQRWKTLVDNVVSPKHKVTIAIVGKYFAIGDYQLKDSYVSITEALHHCGAHHNSEIEIVYMDASHLLEKPDLLAAHGVDGIIIPGGFGESGVEGKIRAIQYAREQKIPFLGLCYGLQLAVVEFSRHVCGLAEAHSVEINPLTSTPVIDILPEQKAISDKGGTMRLGAHPAVLKGYVQQIYGKETTSERHRHRYEVNPEYHSLLEQNGLVLSGKSPDGRLVEFIELPVEQHPFFVATQAHPEFTSRFLEPSPLFMEFVKKSLAHEGLHTKTISTPSVERTQS